MTDAEKDKLLKELYFDLEHGFQSNKQLLKQAKDVIPSIDMDYVKKWKNPRVENVQKNKEEAIHG